MDKEDKVHIQYNAIWPLKKPEILPFAVTWTDLEVIILSEVRQTEKNKFYMPSLICGL